MAKHLMDELTKRLEEAVNRELAYISAAVSRVSIDPVVKDVHGDITEK